MSQLTRSFSEYVSEGAFENDRYPFYIDLHVGTDDDVLRGSFLTQIASGLKGVDHRFFADVEGRIRYRFMTEGDRDKLCQVRNDPDFDYKVRAGMAPPVFSPKR